MLQNSSAPPILSKKIGRNHSSEHDVKRLDEQHFITNIPAGEGRKRKRPTRACFVCSKVQGLNLNFKQKNFILVRGLWKSTMYFTMFQNLPYRN